MASGLNKVFLVGNLGLDPEAFSTREGRPGARMRVATGCAWTDRDGARHEDTQWHTVKAFGPVADTCLRFLQRGSKVLVEGRLHHHSWENEQKETRYRTEVVAARVHFLDRKEGGGGYRRDTAEAPPPPTELAFRQG